MLWFIKWPFWTQIKIFPSTRQALFVNIATNPDVDPCTRRITALNFHWAILLNCNALVSSTNCILSNDTLTHHNFSHFGEFGLPIAPVQVLGCARIGMPKRSLPEATKWETRTCLAFWCRWPYYKVMLLKLLPGSHFSAWKAGSSCSYAWCRWFKMCFLPFLGLSAKL